ncbi:DUF6249 domain-containing protein [Persicitalea sp.]|uniref:DUF6249 domain-containing protein n=1 Tax=Persicitalea sp. TaxID=3100273 RepID=UPI00359484A4
MPYSYFVIIAVCLTIFGMVYTHLTYRYKERAALIDSGLDLDFFRKTLRRQNLMLLSAGLVFIGFSIGVVCGFFFEKYLLINYNPNDYRNYPQAYISMVTLFMGTAMTVAYFLNRRINKQ